MTKAQIRGLFLFLGTINSNVGCLAAAIKDNPAFTQTETNDLQEVVDMTIHLLGLMGRGEKTFLNELEKLNTGGEV